MIDFLLHIAPTIFMFLGWGLCVSYPRPKIRIFMATFFLLIIYYSVWGITYTIGLQLDFYHGSLRVIKERIERKEYEHVINAINTYEKEFSKTNDHKRSVVRLCNALLEDAPRLPNKNLIREDSGALEKVSSLDSSDNVVNEIKYEYNANLQLQKLYQSYSGTLTTYSSAVQYAYDSAHRNWLSSVVYPSGKTLAYGYDSFDNVASINEGTMPLVSYLYDGSGSPMQTTYNQPNVSLSYTGGGLDRYGRVVNHGWVKNDNALVHIVHGYDYAGNRLYRNDLVQAANSELYSYDNLGQIKMLCRGVLNADKTNVPAVNHSEAWNFDKTGNWAEYSKNGMTETRTHNAANELQGIATHDANGNMTLMPGLKGKYDAWNRLVEVRNADDVVIATYEYNGLNQRIKKTVGGVLTKSFYNENWQEVESVTGSQMTSYVWGLRYIDDLVLREKGEERLYSLADPNWNVVALVDATGAVAERMKYDAFGKVTWLDAAFGVKVASDYGWNRTFTGQVLDMETGLMLYRMRFYSTLFGRFISIDTLRYAASDVNLYRYVSNKSNLLTDIFGLKQCGFSVWVYTGSWCVDDNVWDAAMEAAGNALTNTKLMSSDMASCFCGLAYMGDVVNTVLPKPIAQAIELADCFCNVATTAGIIKDELVVNPYGSTQRAIDSLTATIADCASKVTGNMGDSMFDAILLMEQQKQAAQLDYATLDDQMCACKKIARQGANAINDALTVFAKGVRTIYILPR